VHPRGWSVAGRDAEVPTGALDGIGIAISLRARHAQRVGRSKFIQCCAMAILCDVNPFGLRNLQKVGANSGETDRLRGSRAGVRHRHSPQGVLVHPKPNGAGNKDGNQCSHHPIFFALRVACKHLVPLRAEGDTGWAFVLTCSNVDVVTAQSAAGFQLTENTPSSNNNR